MSYEVFGDDDDGGITAEDLWNRGWESDANGDTWWHPGEHKRYTFAQASAIEEDSPMGR